MEGIELRLFRSSVNCLAGLDQSWFGLLLIGKLPSKSPFSHVEKGTDNSVLLVWLGDCNADMIKNCEELSTFYVIDTILGTGYEQ